MRTLSPSAACLMGCLALAADAQADPALQVEQVMSGPYAAQLTAARGADRIAWVFNLKGERNIWIADGPQWGARPITHYRGDDGQAIVSLRLTPDGKTVVYARGGETNGSGLVADPASTGREVKQQVFALDVEGAGEPRLLGDLGCHFEGCEDVQISPDGQRALWMTQKTLWLAPLQGKAAAKRVHYLRGTSGEGKWSPDGRRIAFTLDRGDHSFIVVLTVDTGAVRYLAPSVDRDSTPRWSPDGRQIAWIRVPGKQAGRALIPVRPQPWALWTGDPDGRQAREVFRSGEGLADSLPHFADDLLHFAEGRVVFASEHDGWSHLYSVPADGGTPTLLTPGSFDVEQAVLSADRKGVVYTSNQFGSDPQDQDRRHLWRVGLEGGSPVALTRGETLEWNPALSQDGKEVFCLGSTATSPSMPYRVTAGGREMLAAQAIPRDFPAAELVVPRMVTFPSEDGLTIHGQLFVPRGRTSPGPALIFTHGGPPRQMMLGFHYMEYYHNAYAANQYLASRGYVVLSVNYRLGIMYGRAFREPPQSVWRGSSEYKDVLAGARYLQSLPEVDKARIGLWGGSYGGFLTALGLARNSDIFSAGVDFHGVHDWSAFLRFWEDDPTAAPDYKEARQLAFDSSPNASVSKWRSPVLVIHGDDDRNVPFDQTTDLVQRLRQQKVECEQLIFPDEIHDLLLWRSWVKSYTAMGDFFDRKLK